MVLGRYTAYHGTCTCTSIKIYGVTYVMLCTHHATLVGTFYDSYCICVSCTCMLCCYFHITYVCHVLPPLCATSPLGLLHVMNFVNEKPVWSTVVAPTALHCSPPGNALVRRTSHDPLWSGSTTMATFKPWSVNWAGLVYIVYTRSHAAVERST